MSWLSIGIVGEIGSSSRSVAVNTPTTPGEATASETSIPVISA